MWRVYLEHVCVGTHIGFGQFLVVRLAGTASRADAHGAPQQPGEQRAQAALLHRSVHGALARAAGAAAAAATGAADEAAAPAADTGAVAGRRMTSGRRRCGVNHHVMAALAAAGAAAAAGGGADGAVRPF